MPSENIHADYEISLLRLIEKVTNGTVIEISLTGAHPLPLLSSVTQKANRYCNRRQAWNYCRRAGHTRLPYLQVYRIFLRADRHARSLFKKPSFSDTEGNHI